MYSQWGEEVTRQAQQEYSDWYYQFDNGKTIEYSSRHQGKALTNEDITSDLERKKCPLYNDFNHKFECENQLILGANTGDYFTSIVATKPKQAGWFNDIETDIFEMLSRSIVQSIQLSSHLESQFGNDFALQLILKDERNATLLVDQHLNILWQSKAAEEFLSLKGDLYSQTGKLKIDSSQLRSQVKHIVNQAIEKNLQEIEQHQTLCIRQNNIPTSLNIFSANKNTIFATDQSAVAALVIRVPKEYSEKNTNALKILYGLTPAETKLTIAITNGVSLKQYASINHISANTAKSTLRDISDKVGTHSQTELASIISRQL